MFKMQGLDHIAITVSDLERSVKWYQEVLGMERQYADVWGDVPAMMMVGGSGIALFRAKAAAPKPQPGDDTLRMRHLAFRATRADFDKAQEALRQRGIDFEFSDHT